MIESVFGLQKQPGEEWAFNGTDWKTIPDPMAQWSDTEEHWYEALSRAGYFVWFTVGDRGSNFWFTAFAPNPANPTTLQTHFPYLVNVKIVCSMDTVYCASLPALLALLEKLNALHTVWRAGKDEYGRPQATDRE